MMRVDAGLEAHVAAVSAFSLGHETVTAKQGVKGVQQPC